MAIFTQNPDYTAKIVNVNETVVGENYKMSQVIADFNAIGVDCDSVIMHDWRGRGYGAFIPLKITEQNSYYVGDNDLTSGLGTNATLWQKSNTVWGGHYYRYVNGVPADYGALSLGSQTVDNIEYWYDYDGNVSYIPLFYLDSSITVVINKVPVPPSTKYTSNGGGATHIAKVTGQLKDLSSNLSDILMVSGGGGGGYLTGVPGWDGHEIEILTSGENRTLTAQRSNDTLTFKLFTSGTEIYSFSPAVSDLSKINLSFIADLENEVAKPSLIYDVGSDSYSYNQETPTDEEMADIFTWLDGSLPYVHVYHGYKTDNSPELYWAASKNITIDAPSRESLSVWKAYIVVIHRQTVTLPEGWTLLDTRINRSGWQYVSVYSKVVTQSETVTVSQESENALSLMSFYTDQYNTVVYDDEYYGDSANPMNWVFPAADYPRIFAFSLGYTTEGGVTTTSVTYSPALNGWQEPNIFSSADNYRSMLFYMTGEETSTTTLTYNGFSATGQWAEDKANSSQIVAYKVIYYRV